jgi:hypothetical protein
LDGDREERKKWRRQLMLGTGPRAADILAGNWKDEAGDGGYASTSDSMVKSSKRK